MELLIGFGIVVALIAGIAIGIFLLLHFGIGTLLDVIFGELGLKEKKGSKKGGEKR